MDILAVILYVAITQPVAAVLAGMIHGCFLPPFSEPEFDQYMPEIQKHTPQYISAGHELSMFNYESK